MDRGKTVTPCKPRGKPFRPRSIGLYLVGRHPTRSNGDGSHGPGLSVTSTSPCPAASRTRLSVSLARREKPGRYESRRTETQPCQRAERFGLTRVTGHLIMQDTPPCRPEIVKERSRRFRVIGGEGHGGIAAAWGAA